MRAFLLSLRILAVALVVSGSLHLFLGLRADRLLGATVASVSLNNASLDSQNRFYGVAFSLIGIVLYLCTTDLQRYAPMMNAALGVLFASGVARVVSWAVHGTPSPAILGILCLDLFLPPILYAWYGRITASNPAGVAEMPNASISAG